MNFSQIKNPVSAEKVAEIVKNFHAEVSAHSVSFTGGEPLLHWKFISEVSELLKDSGLKIFLETNGTLAEDFKKISDAVDIVSMDIKLPSVIGENLFDLHRKFIEAAWQKDLYIKIVVSEETATEEFLEAVNLIPKNILLIIQPVTPFGAIKKATAEKILSLQSLALQKLNDVRVIPQTHRLINVF